MPFFCPPNARPNRPGDLPLPPPPLAKNVPARGKKRFLIDFDRSDSPDMLENHCFWESP
jgi:hypothetical protein